VAEVSFGDRASPTIRKKERDHVAVVSSSFVSDITATAATSGYWLLSTAATATAAATAAAAVATTATAASAATTTATAAESATAGFAGLGFVDGQSAAVMFLAIERADGGLRLGVAAHLNETKAFASAGFAVLDHFSRLNGSVRCTELFEV
jgi:hypothetical protein